MIKFIEDGLIDWNQTVPERQPDGTVHFYSMETGELLSIMGDRALVSRSPVQVNEVVREDGTKVYLQVGVEATDKVLGSRMIQYSKPFAEVLCSRIAGGKSLKALSEEPGMPSYATLMRWRTTVPEFAKMLDVAYADQADYRADKIMDEIDQVDADPDEIAKAGLKLKATQWAAQVHKPGKYAPRTKVMGDANSPLQFVIETGIRRSGDDGYNVDETAKLREVTPTEGVLSEVEAKGSEVVPTEDKD